jgi:hypothetical protein
MWGFKPTLEEDLCLMLHPQLPWSCVEPPSHREERTQGKKHHWKSSCEAGMERGKALEQWTLVVKMDQCSEEKPFT